MVLSYSEKLLSVSSYKMSEKQLKQMVSHLGNLIELEKKDDSILNEIAVLQKRENAIEESNNILQVRI